MKSKNKTGLIVITLITLAAVITLLFLEPIEQKQSYHNFSDSLTIFGIPNIWNIVSNLPFLIVGVVALYKLFVVRSLNIDNAIRYSYMMLFIAVLLVAFGSGYYHLHPVNQTLVWDRLPMAVAFMALFSIVISEYISLKVGKYLLLPLVVVGIVSVLYWYSVDDLRLYVLVQFLPVLLIPVILIFFDSHYDDDRAYWLLLVCYAAAKLFELFDREVNSVLVFIGGHPFKHVMAALGVYILLTAYVKRSKLIE